MRDARVRKTWLGTISGSALALAVLVLGGGIEPARSAEAVTGAAQAASKPASPDAATLLFEAPQLAGTRPDQTLAYAYVRKVGNPELGASFEDRILLKVAARSGDDGRDITVDFFSPERHRAAGPFEGVTTNPVLLLFLENHLADLAGRLKGNPRYFKTAIRTALRDAATVSPMEAMVDGKAAKGWRIVVVPFKGDANASRMRGLDGLAYTFEVVPDLPGQIARIEVTAEATGGRLWEESITYDPKGN